MLKHAVKQGTVAKSEGFKQNSKQNWSTYKTINLALVAGIIVFDVDTSIDKVKQGFQ